MITTFDGLCTQFAEDVTEEALFAWAEMFGIKCNHEQWLDDDWPDKIGEVRVKVAEALSSVGAK